MTFEKAFVRMIKEGEQSGKRYTAATVRAMASAWNIMAIAMKDGGLEDCVNVRTDADGNILDFISTPIEEFGAPDFIPAEKEKEALEVKEELLKEIKGGKGKAGKADKNEKEDAPKDEKPGDPEDFKKPEKEDKKEVDETEDEESIEDMANEDQ